MARSVVPASSKRQYLAVNAQANGHGGYDLFADSHHIIDLFLYLKFTQLVNLAPTVTMPFSRVIPAGARHLYLFTLNTAASGQRSYRLMYTFARGNPKSTHHDGNQRYLFPYEHGTKHRVTQGYGGRYTHYGENEYALDFDLDVGTAVYAARDGIVAEMRSDSNVGGRSPSYEKRSNYILIAHADGSFGNYVHLKHGGVLVSPGDRVDAGQIIGYSGNTGRTSGPHLHFDVRIPTLDGRMRSIPVCFLRPPQGSVETVRCEAETGQKRTPGAGDSGRGAGAPAAGTHPALKKGSAADARRNRTSTRAKERGNHLMDAVVPAEGQYYYAYHPGSRPFTMILGSDITNEQYAGYEMHVPRSGKASLRIIRIDATYVVFVRNGLSEPVSVQINVGLRGMTTTTRLPVEMILPAETELFATLLRPVPGVVDYGYSYRLRVRGINEK